LVEVEAWKIHLQNFACLSDITQSTHYILEVACRKLSLLHYITEEKGH